MQHVDKLLDLPTYNLAITLASLLLQDETDAAAADQEKGQKDGKHTTKNQANFM